MKAVLSILGVALRLTWPQSIGRCFEDNPISLDALSSELSLICLTSGPREHSSYGGTDPVNQSRNQVIEGGSRHGKNMASETMRHGLSPARGSSLLIHAFLEN